MDKKKAIESLKQYLVKLSKKIKVDDALIYGSILTKKFKEESDIDLIVLSSEFKDLEPDERLRMLYRNALYFPYNLHVYGLTQEEFNSAPKLSLLSFIKKKAKRIKFF